MKIVYVTNNLDKVNAVQEILGNRIKVKHLSLGLIEPQSIDPREVSESKAKQAYEIIKKPLFVTDAGFSLEAFNGFPGALVKFIYNYIGQEGLLRLLNDVKNRNAKAIISLTFYDGKIMKTFEGVTEGTITKQPWSEGWEFDRIFIPKGSTKTWAEMGLKMKNKDSYFRAALEKFLNWLKNAKF